MYVNPMQLALSWVGSRACFVAGTQVVVGVNEDGSYLTRNIEDLLPGDIVLSRDQYDPNDDLDLKPVVQVFRKVSDHLRILRVQAKDGNIETIQTTDDHPFWVEGIGWVRAGDLRIGDQVDQSDGSGATIISSFREAHPEGIAVYNFEVESDHTYFVEDGQGEKRPIWVHNECRSLINQVKGFVNYAVRAARNPAVQKGLDFLVENLAKGITSAGKGARQISGNIWEMRHIRTGESTTVRIADYCGLAT